MEKTAYKGYVCRAVFDRKAVDKTLAEHSGKPVNALINSLGGSLNADQFATLIAACEKIKADLDKLDQNVARLYAARCKRKPEELLDLMKVGG